MRLIFFVLILLTSNIIYSQDIAKIIQEGDTFETKMDENSALNKYLEAYKSDPNNVVLLCKISELYSSIAGRFKTDPAKQSAYFTSALNYAQKALAINPKSADANFVMALVLGRTALKKSGKEKIDAVKGIKKYTDLSIQYNPNNYKAWFLLGKWYYEISGLNFFERAGVKLFYGELPNASTKQAITSYNKSMELNNTFLYNYLALARAYVRDDNKDKAIELLNTMLKLPLKTADDADIKTEARKLLKKIE